MNFFLIKKSTTEKKNQSWPTLIFQFNIHFYPFIFKAKKKRKKKRMCYSSLKQILTRNKQEIKIKYTHTSLLVFFSSSFVRLIQLVIKIVKVCFLLLSFIPPFWPNKFRFLKGNNNFYCLIHRDDTPWTVLQQFFSCIFTKYLFWKKYIKKCFNKHMYHHYAN